ncbi:MAG: putative sulfate exporter family transporter [Betaproteobacteria bacterium]|nr:putative sulfate exporter family transporter [Betaproteobacteria bacterium]MBI3938985.1 putative sulfate exporter family transporter [Betaproteobacteria bacterium]
MAAKEWRTEDWVAVYLGIFVIAATLVVFSGKIFDLRSVNVSFRWTTDAQIVSRTPGWNSALDAIVKEAETKGQADVAVKAKAMRDSLQKGERKGIEKAAGDLQKTGKRTVPSALGGEIRGHATAVAGTRVFSQDNLLRSLYLGIAALIVAAVGIALIGGPVWAFVIGFPVVFVLAWLSRFLAGNGLAIDGGIEYVIFALILGLLISNTIGVPEWLKPAVQTEFYIKTGLVILGAGLLFYEILEAGALGIIQALLVVGVVWYFCFWLARKLRVDDDFAAILSSGVAICGVSAAIATCGAIQGDKKKLSYVTSIVLIVAVPMMVLMPWAVKALGIPDLVGGAWLGGTLDTTATVVAAGALISDAAMKTGVIVKFSQNALIGVAAFILVLWWTFKAGATTGERPNAGIIWERFPKFILGFLVASAVFSFFLPTGLVDGTKGALATFRTWWFALAFVSIGLETRFWDLAKMEGGRPALAFLGAQAFNIVWTLILAFLLFGGYIFPVPDIK